MPRMYDDEFTANAVNVIAVNLSRVEQRLFHELARSGYPIRLIQPGAAREPPSLDHLDSFQPTGERDVFQNRLIYDPDEAHGAVASVLANPGSAERLKVVAKCLENVMWLWERIDAQDLSWELAARFGVLLAAFPSRASIRHRKRISQSEIASGPRYAPPDALDEQIKKMVAENPKISTKVVRKGLDLLIGKGLIESINDQENKIYYKDAAGRIRHATIRGLKDRLFRAKRERA